MAIRREVIAKGEHMFKLSLGRNNETIVRNILDAVGVEAVLRDSLKLMESLSGYEKAALLYRTTTEKIKSMIDH